MIYVHIFPTESNVDCHAAPAAVRGGRFEMHKSIFDCASKDNHMVEACAC